MAKPDETTNMPAEARATAPAEVKRDWHEDNSEAYLEAGYGGESKGNKLLPPSRRKRCIVWAVIILVIVGVALGVGLAFGLKHSSSASTYSSPSPIVTPPSPPPSPPSAPSSPSPPNLFPCCSVKCGTYDTDSSGQVCCGGYAIYYGTTSDSYCNLPLSVANCDTFC